MFNTRRQLALASIAMASMAPLLAWSADGRTSTHARVAPFTYEMVVTYFIGGEQARSERVVHAVGTDGSFAEITEMRTPGGERYERHAITDLERLQRSISYSGIDVVTTAPISPQTAARLRANKAKRCGLDKGAETSRIHGYDVIQSVFRSAPTTPSQEALEVEKWLAPALGCEPLGMTWKKNGEVVLSHVTKRIHTGEPAEFLFKRSPEFVEASPGDVARRMAEELGVGVSAPLGAMEQRVEDEYFRSRKAAGWD